MFYKYNVLIFVVLLMSALTAQSQSVSELENRYKNAKTKNDKLSNAFQLAEKLLSGSPAKSAEYAVIANNLATEIGDKRKESDAAMISAEATYRLKNYKDAAARFTKSWNTARNYGFKETALNASDKLQDIAMKQNDYKEALKWSRETINYLRETGGGGRSGGDTQRRIENQLAAAEADNRALREQLAKATGQTQVLETTYQSQLKEATEKTQQELLEKQAELNKVSYDKVKSDSMVSKANRMVANFTKEQLVDSIVLAQQERELQINKRELAEVQLKKEQSDNIRNLLGLVAAFVFVLAGLFFMRFRAQKRTASELTSKNILIEAEQKRSDDLLLNILPPAIAKELKTRNKVAAQKYDQATVMFIDFKGFTNVSEQLSPEMLVEELDLCFSNFDRIIGQYRIEKIKTIGDAYMCASGLSDMNASPADIIKAALEIQDFLQALKAERMGLGMPFFEARVGVHCGPVVAGVVGAKKFAYDIWGDTVNTAARIEEACEPGKVNVSEVAYWLAKYDFEWLHRGKIAAKNKGQLDMYYVTAMK